MAMKRGDEIEVSSDQEGLKGSWFKAIIEDDLPKSGTKKLNVSLLANNGSTTTRKTTYLRFIRPIPPESLFTTAVEFEEGSVVESSHRGGWWTGVVIKKINDEKVLVYFDSPPELFQFKTGQLRQHFDWVKQKWVRPRNKVLSKKSTFSCGTMVEVNDEEDVWVPSVIVKGIGNMKSFIVKSFKYHNWNENDGEEEPKPNRTVGLESIRLTQAVPVPVERYELMESVEVFLEPGWRSGTVTGVLCDDKYTVCLKGTKNSFWFKHESIRPLEESDLQNTGEVNAAITPKMSLSSEGNRLNEVPEEHNREDESRKRKRGEVEHIPDISETAATESVSSLTTSPATTATALKQTKSGTEEITLHPESIEEGNTPKRKREHSLGSTPGVEEPQAKDAIAVLPFAKESSLWKELETMEVFQRAPPQSPHFSPLVGESEVFREGLAFGLLLTFSKLLESFKDLEPDVTVTELKSLGVSFAKLEKHGFDVSAPLERINKLLALKDRHVKTMEERNGFDEKIMALKEDSGEMEDKIIELERQQVAVKEQICEMESCARDRGKELDNLESEFKATSYAPWGEA